MVEKLLASYDNAKFINVKDDPLQVVKEIAEWQIHYFQQPARTDRCRQSGNPEYVSGIWRPSVRRRL